MGRFPYVIGATALAVVLLPGMTPQPAWHTAAWAKVVEAIEVVSLRRSRVPVSESASGDDTRIAEDSEFFFPQMIREDQTLNGWYPIKNKDGKVFYVKPIYLKKKHVTCDVSASALTDSKIHGTLGAGEACR